MLVDDTLLGRIASKWQKDLFKSKFENLIGYWCVKYYFQYSKAPRRDILGLFEVWAESSKDKETTELVSNFLSSLSDEYEQSPQDSNSEYLIDLAGKHFNDVKLDRHIQELQTDKDNGETEKAFVKASQFNRIEMGTGDWIDVLRDKEGWKAAFAETEESIVKYPKPIDEFFGDALCRDALIGFTGPEKRGKTWWLLDLAWRGMLQRRKVAFFEIGDLSKNQIRRRFGVRVAKHSVKPKTVKYPLSISKEEEDDIAIVKFEDRVFDKKLDWSTCNDACEEVIREKVKSNQVLLRLCCHPAGKIGVQGIQSQLEMWDREGWVPDVVVIDYDKLLANPPGLKDPIEIIDKNWEMMRALSQEWHCLVATATQANAASYKVKTLSKIHFSGSKTKLAHCTGMIALNQIGEEKERNVMRLSWMLLREDEFTEGKCIHVAQCLSLANPCVRGTF